MCVCACMCELCVIVRGRDGEIVPVCVCVLCVRNLCVIVKEGGKDCLCVRYCVMCGGLASV